MNKTCKIVIDSNGKKNEYRIRKGLRLDALAAKFETNLEFSCHKANCGICLFKVIKGQDNISTMNSKEKKFLEAMKSEKDERLACQCRIFGDVTMEVESYDL